MQITAEQIVREAKEHQEEDFKPPTQKIADVEELAEYRLQKRKEFEDLIRRVYWNESVWVKYAKWEESQKDFARARSVWERALDHHHRSHSLWLKYAEMEMSNKFVNHARKRVGPRGDPPPPRRSVLVQVRAHGGDDGSDRQRARHLRAVDAMGAGSQRLERVHPHGDEVQGVGAACAPSTSDTASAIPPSRRGCDGPSSR